MNPDFAALPEYDDSTAEEIHALIEMKKMTLLTSKNTQNAAESNSEYR
jgi:hypothetical protein